MQYLVANINVFSESELSVALTQMPLNQREYILRKKREVSRKQSIIARILLNNLLSEFGISDGYNIDFETNGKPYYLNSSKVHFSISHSKDFVAVAVSSKPVGIDIQFHKSVNEKLVKRVCTNEECEFVKKAGNNVFLKLWTVKEAYSKCTGIKLTDVFKLSFIKDDSVFGLDKKLYSFSKDIYELSIIE